MTRYEDSYKFEQEEPYDYVDPYGNPNDYGDQDWQAQENESVCIQHPDATVTDVQEFTGFAGGKSYAYTLSCGCGVLDESDDVRAAE
jgi:hypothetical protein